MTICKSTSKRKSTGGRLSTWRKAKKHSLGRDTNPTTLGKDKVTMTKTMGGNKLISIIRTQFANLSANGKINKVKILDVSKNSANRHFVRRKVLTKGAIIKTDKGEAIITSRPTRDGVLNAKLIK